jgi:AraC-like DNA-binding protein
VSRIAEASGFSGATRFGIVFRRVTGMTPTQYRDERVLKPAGAGDAKPVAARSSTIQPRKRKGASAPATVPSSSGRKR